jgi:hypothetical protein
MLRMSVRWSTTTDALSTGSGTGAGGGEGAVVLPEVPLPDVPLSGAGAGAGAGGGAGEASGAGAGDASGAGDGEGSVVFPLTGGVSVPGTGEGEGAGEGGAGAGVPPAMTQAMPTFAMFMQVGLQEAQSNVYAIDSRPSAYLGGGGVGVRGGGEGPVARRRGSEAEAGGCAAALGLRSREQAECAEWPALPATNGWVAGWLGPPLKLGQRQGNAAGGHAAPPPPPLPGRRAPR